MKVISKPQMVLQYADCEPIQINWNTDVEDLYWFIATSEYKHQIRPIKLIKMVRHALDIGLEEGMYFVRDALEYTEEPKVDPVRILPEGWGFFGFYDDGDPIITKQS